MKPLILFLILAVFSFGFLIYQHEVAHREIYESFGCVDVGYGIDTTAVFTYCKTRTAMTERTQLNEAEAISHNINESVGYHMTALFMLIIIVTSCVMFQIKYG